jgi:predicted branched-subunit amino acid permease
MIGVVTSTELLEPSAGRWVTSEEDRTLATLLVCRGLPVRVVAWDDDSVDWSAFSLLVLRSPWTSRQPPSAYLAWLRRVDAVTTLCPPRPVIEWSLHQPLAALEQQGVPVLPQPGAGGGEHALVLLRDQEQHAWLVANAWCKAPVQEGAPDCTRETLLVPTDAELALAWQTLRALYRCLGSVMPACLVVRVDLVQDAVGTWRLTDVEPHAPRLLLHRRAELAWALVEAIRFRHQQASARCDARLVARVGPRGAEEQAPPPDAAGGLPQLHAPARRADAAQASVEWWRGVLAGLPLALSIVPFMGIFAVLARAAGLSALETQAMSLLIFSGAQLVAAQMLLAGAPVALIVGVGAVLNARHLLYGAALAPYLHALPLRWRCLLGYLLSDEAFAVGSTHYQQPGTPTRRHWFLLGAGLVVWGAAQGGTGLGILLGEHLPASWDLAFTAPLGFLALAVLALKDRASLAAAVTALSPRQLFNQLGKMVMTTLKKRSLLP